MSFMGEIASKISYCTKIAVGYVTYFTMGLVKRPARLFYTWDRIKFDLKAVSQIIEGHSFKEVFKVAIGEAREGYFKLAKVDKNSKSLGIEIVYYDGKEGNPSFRIPRYLFGDVTHFTDQMVKGIEGAFKDLKAAGVVIDKYNNSITLEIDVEKIVSEIREKSPNIPDKDAIEAISNKIESSFKKLTKITGGSLEEHDCSRIVKETARTLYNSYKETYRSSEKEVAFSNGKEIFHPGWREKIQSPGGKSECSKQV